MCIRDRFTGIAYFLLPTVLILKQPDLGTSLVYVAMFLPVLVYSGVPRKILGKLALSGMVIAPIYWMILKAVSYTHLRAHETVLDLVCRLLLEQKKQKKN